jgi:hypothetical protein
MPTLAEIYRTLQEHEAAEKTASVKKQAIASPHGAGQPGIGATLEDVLGSNVAETKVRIKKKLEEVAGGEKAVEGLSAHPEESPAQVQAPAAVKMAPGGEKGEQVTTGLSGKVSAALAKAEEKSAEVEKSAEEKLAEEYFAAGQIQAQGFCYELNRLMGGEAK